MKSLTTVILVRSSWLVVVSSIVVMGASVVCSTEYPVLRASERDRGLMCRSDDSIEERGGEDAVGLD